MNDASGNSGDRWAPVELVESAMRSERELEHLVGVIWPRCFRLAATVLGDLNLAQDAAQEACVIVYRKLHGLRQARKFDAWLYRIVMRESARLRRRQRRAAQEYERTSTTSQGEEIDVWRALEALSPKLRDVAILYYFDDLPADEIAGILRIPHVTVRTRLTRARERLRGLLGEYANPPANIPTERQHGF